MPARTRPTCQHPGRDAWHAQGLYKVFTGLSAHCRYGLHVSAQRARSAVEASHRSIHPNIPGVPWWAALLIATTATAIGYAIDAGSGHKELTDVFAGLYIAGCVVAVLAVRQSGVFTAVIQPPLILFCAVPGAYWLFHGGKVGNLKDLLINCGYPLIERFPLMLGTAGGVLLIGLIRWYFGLSHRTTTPANTTDDVPTSAESDVKVRHQRHRRETGLVSRPRRGRRGRRRRGSVRRRAPGSTRLATPQNRPSSPRQSVRPTHRPNPLPAFSTAAGAGVRTAGRASAARKPPGSAAARDFEPADPPRRSRRRPRPQGDPDLRAQPPREMRRDPYGRRNRLRAAGRPQQPVRSLRRALQSPT